MTSSPVLGPRYRRSPFLLAGWEGSDVILTECNSLRRFRVDERLVGLLGRLERWRTVGEVAPDGLVSVEDLERLHAIGVVERSDSSMNDEQSAQVWNPFDLVVHRQQNTGGEMDHGPSDPPPPAAFKSRPSGRVAALPPARSLPARLDEVLNTRRSIRAYSSSPLDLEDLSTLLHHSARVMKVIDDPRLGQQVFRPYPTGGARSELELYVVANDVAGLEPGAHWYDPRAHDLVQLRSRDDDQQRLNRSVHDATGGLPRDPQAVVLVTAVFARVMWKYQGIALGLIHRDVGCLYQTLYLVATALGLAPCAVGAGPELANARWLGLDPLVESQVGCFLVGRG